MPSSDQARLAAALGYDGLEIAPFTLDGDQPHRLGAETVNAVRRAVADAGIVVSGLHWLLVAPQGLSITSADDAVRAQTLEVMHGLVRLCAGLGGTYLVHGSPGQRQLEPGARSGRPGAGAGFLRRSRARRRGGRRHLHPRAAVAGPDQLRHHRRRGGGNRRRDRLAGPAHHGRLLLRRQQRDRPPFPICFARYIPDGSVVHVHFNDPNRRGPGQGDLDFAPIVAALERLSYDGWIGVEPFDYVPDGPGVAARAIGYIAGLRAGLA